MLTRVWFGRGRVRELDKIGNDMAGRAADLGRRSVAVGTLDARRPPFQCVQVLVSGYL